MPPKTAISQDSFEFYADRSELLSEKSSGGNVTSLFSHAYRHRTLSSISQALRQLKAQSARWNWLPEAVDKDDLPLGALLPHIFSDLALNGRAVHSNIVMGWFLINNAARHLDSICDGHSFQLNSSIKYTQYLIGGFELLSSFVHVDKQPQFWANFQSALMAQSMDVSIHDAEALFEQRYTKNTYILGLLYATEGSLDLSNQNDQQRSTIFTSFIEVLQALDDIADFYEDFSSGQASYLLTRSRTLSRVSPNSSRLAVLEDLLVTGAIIDEISDISARIQKVLNETGSMEVITAPLAYILQFTVLNLNRIVQTYSSVECLNEFYIESFDRDLQIVAVSSV